MTDSSRHELPDDWLRRSGVDQAAVVDARRAGQLHLLVAAEQAVPNGPSFTANDVARNSGLDRAEVADLWMSFGFPTVPFDDQVRFTQADLDAFKVVAEVRTATRITHQEATALARVIGSATSRVAEAGVSSVASAGADYDSTERAQRLMTTADVTLPGVAQLLDFAWRRHLHATVTRNLSASERPDPQTLPHLTVGFADLSGFTALSHQLSPTALEELIARFADTVHTVVRRGDGRVVKMLGDEVMFVTDDPADGVRIGVDLVTEARADGLLSELKVGLATGPVLAREGDYFGLAVNTASRVTGLTRPGAVVVTDQLRELIAPAEPFRWRNLHRCYLRDLGWVRLWSATTDASRRPGNPATRIVSVLSERVRLSLEQAAALRGPVG